MATSDELRRGAPYYDDFDPMKQYTQILAVPGRVEQAREFTQMQTMMYHYLKKLSDTLFKDGSITSGMSFSITKDNKLIVEDGRVYIDGKIHEFKRQEIQLKGTGREIIGVELNMYIVTEETDVSLRDPAQNMDNFGQPGSHRIKSEPKLTLNNPNAPVLFELEDKQLVVAVSKPSFDSLNEILAKRTHDESGNYRVIGLDLVAEPKDASNVQLTVEAGTAYILGYQIIKPTPVKKTLPISKDVKAALNEPKIYSSGTKKYALNNFPAKRITKVVAQVEVTQNITRGSVADGIDQLPKTPVVSIQEVKAGTTTYVQGTDYQLTSDGVDWGFRGQEPAIGSTYTVRYRYNKVMVQGTDYKLTQETGAWGETKDYVEFLSADLPVPNSQYTVDYEFFLARVDLISMDSKGEVNVTSGQPNIDRLVTPPVSTDANQLTLGTVYFPPNSGNAQAKTKVITRLEMGDLQRMHERLEEVEYNQAITALDREAMAGEPPGDLKGVFSDSFRTPSKGDLEHPEFNVMYSLEDGMIMLPPKNTKAVKPTVNISSSNAKVWGRLITAPLTEIAEIDQPYATTTMKINPYLAFNAMGVLKLDPEVDNWIDDEYINVEETKFEARKFYRWWRHGEDPSLKDNVSDLFDLEMENGGKVGDWRPEWWPGVVDQTGTAIKTEKSTSIMNEAITNMRQIEVKIKGSNLDPAADNLECLFDGIRVPLTPLSGYQAGTTPGTVKSNSSGVTEAKFMIPAGVRTGTREVILRNATNTAAAPFTAIGTKRTTVDKIIRTRITMQVVDPLAQTFQFDKATVVTSISAYFAAKDTTHNVLVQVRNTVNGYPGNVVYAEKVLSPSQLNISENATAETKVTFDDPIMCNAGQQYSVVYLTDSAVHAMHVADLGGKDVTTGNMVTRQPYLAGMLFSSSNGLAWTAHQSMNLKFKVYTAKFEPTGTIEFDPLYDITADKILLLTDFLTPQNTGCIWEVSLDDQPYLPITQYKDIDTNKVITKVRLKATFKSDTNMSPLIAKDSFTLVGFLTATEGSYISRMTQLEQDVTSVKQTFEAFIPQGSTIQALYSLDDGVTWTLTPQVATRQISSEWSRITFEHKFSAPNKRKFRARINIKTPSSVVRPKVRKFTNVIK
ncbi:hypothetical protein [Bacillus phage Nachito]|nr:hypothetical protein [Bacillus phage Nachito]